MNLVDGRLAESGVSIGGVTIPVHRPCEPGRPVLVGLRPEHFELAAAGPIAFRIALLERLGADTILHGRLGGDGPAIAVRVSGAIVPAPGETLSFAIRPDRVHLFDPRTGRRIGVDCCRRIGVDCCRRIGVDC